jgi:glycine/serine hydroxymethyltransferase
MSIDQILGTVAAHEERRLQTVNLVASENLLSPAARAVLASDLTHRYCIPPVDQRPPAVWDYPNQVAPRSLEQLAERLACRALDAQVADARPLSGNNAAYILIKSLMQRDEAMASVPGACGGHFATDEICSREGVVRHDIVYDWATGAIDVAATAALCEREQVKLVFLDASMQSFPYPVKELRAALPSDVIIAYDASHTMGIIAGGGFQNPLDEGADLIQGSTHKSLFGPQKALFAYARRDETYEAIHSTVVPLFVSNSHPHHTAVLAVALQEALDFGGPYARQVVANARALAGALHAAGATIPFADRQFTDCHQFVWAIGPRDEAERKWVALEAAGLHVNLVRVPFQPGTFGFRIGSSELTRRGMGSAEMSELATLMADIVINGVRGDGTQRHREAVGQISSKFPHVYFGYQQSGEPLGLPA